MRIYGCACSTELARWTGRRKLLVIGRERCHVNGKVVGVAVCRVCVELAWFTICEDCVVTRVEREVGLTHRFLLAMLLMNGTRWLYDDSVASEIRSVVAFKRIRSRYMFGTCIVVYANVNVFIHSQTRINNRAIQITFPSQL